MQKRKSRKRDSLAWRRYLKTPQRKYQEHKGHARSRNVPFTLTFSEWWEIWASSGKYKTRGNRKGKHCMHRIADRGGYSLGNVYIGTFEGNSFASACSTNGRQHPDDIAKGPSIFPNGDPGDDVPF